MIIIKITTLIWIIMLLSTLAVRAEEITDPDILELEQQLAEELAAEQEDTSGNVATPNSAMARANIQPQSQPKENEAADANKSAQRQPAMSNVAQSSITTNSSQAAPEPEANISIAAQSVPPISPHSTMSLPEYNKNHRFDFLYKYPAEVLDVKTVCPWRSKTEMGWLRVTRTLEQGSNKFYLQWIRSEQANPDRLYSGEHKLLTTLSIDEINEYANFRFAMPKHRIGVDACELAFVLTNSQTHRKFKAKLFVKGPGKYQCELSSIISDGF